MTMKTMSGGDDVLRVPCRVFALVDIVIGATTVSAETFLLTSSLVRPAANPSTIY